MYIRFRDMFGWVKEYENEIENVFTLLELAAFCYKTVELFVMAQLF